MTAIRATSCNTEFTKNSQTMICELQAVKKIVSIINSMTIGTDNLLLNISTSQKI